MAAKTSKKRGRRGTKLNFIPNLDKIASSYTNNSGSPGDRRRLALNRSDSIRSSKSKPAYLSLDGVTMTKEGDNGRQLSSRQSLFGVTAKERLMDETKEMALKAKIKLDKIKTDQSPARLGDEPSKTLGFNRSNTPLLFNSGAGMFTPKENSRFEKGRTTRKEPSFEP